MTVFDSMPIACVINGKFLAVHGGISPHIPHVKDINKLNRYIEPPQTGGLCDLIWSDPINNTTGELEKSWINNEIRGCSFYFGKDATNQFLKYNNLLTIIRAHEAEFEGFKAYFWKSKNIQFPQVVTIFSAPNYCGYYANKGAIGKLENNDLKII